MAHKNRHEIIKDGLREKMKNFADNLAPQMRGGDHKAFHAPMSDDELADPVTVRAALDRLVKARDVAGLRSLKRGIARVYGVPDERANPGRMT